MRKSPLQLNVSDLVGHPGAHRIERLSAELPLAMDMARVVGPVDVEVRLDATSQEIVASGRAEYRLVTTCNRCLVEGEWEDSLRFEQIYAVEPREDGDEELPAVDPSGWIDLESVIRDEVGLALPLKPLCREECLGLCPTCGTDLNTEPCEGHEDLSTSPFAVLERFLDPQD